MSANNNGTIGTENTGDSLCKFVGAPEDIHGEWRSVPGFDEKDLLVSSKGWVRTKTKGGKIRSLGDPKLGYRRPQGGYRVRSGSKSYLVHQLILLAFDRPPKPGETVDHIDKNQDNNDITNLRWANWSTQRKNQGIRKKARTTKRVVLVAKDGTRLLFDSRKQAADTLQLNRSNIAQSIAKGCEVAGYTAFDAPLEQQDIPGEEWRPSYCWPDTLHVSDLGRIQRRDDRGNGWGHRITPVPARGMMYAMARSRDEAFLVHRIVKITFDGYDNDCMKTVVDHVDRNTSNNKLSNLRWATCKQNAENREVCMGSTRT